MAQLPNAVEQVLRLHATFIHSVVNALRDRTQMSQLQEHLKAAEEAGWGRLVAVIRQIVDGRRGEDMKLGLDEEDRIGGLSLFENGLVIPVLGDAPSLACTGKKFLRIEPAVAGNGRNGAGDDLADAVVAIIRDVEIAKIVNGDAGGGINRGIDGRASIAAVAISPLPATVVRLPEVSTLRTHERPYSAK